MSATVKFQNVTDLQNVRNERRAGFDLQDADGMSLKAQLEREISCLVKQLDRLKYLDAYLDTSTIKTYEEMISNRKDMLGELR